MASPKKECLKEIVQNFLTEINKLDRVEETTRNRNFSGSFFLSNYDVSRIKARNSVLKELFSTVLGDINQKVDYKDRVHGMPVSCKNKEHAIKKLNENIDKMSDIEAEETLAKFLEEIVAIIDS